MLTHHNMLSIAHSALTMIDVYQEDLFLSFLPLSHTLERTGGYYLPVMSGSGWPMRAPSCSWPKTCSISGPRS